MDFIELILTSLELVAEEVEDLTVPVYEHYYSASPESRDLMDHMDMLMCGRMLNEVIGLLVMPDEDLQITLKFEVNDVLNTARVWYAVNLSDSRQGVTGEVKFTVEYGNKVHSPKQPKINILGWDQRKIIDDFLTVFEKWES